MENKLNLIELLKDCPKGMELDCTMFENVTFEGINKQSKFPIIIKIGEHCKYLTKEGCYIDTYCISESKCVIFPKGKTTWEGFIPPCKFKDGSWITNGDYTWQVISHDNFDYTLQNQYGKYIDDTIDYVNKAFHLWTIEDAKDGDVLFHSDSASNGIFIFKEILQCGTIQKVICYCDYDSEDGFCLGENHTCCWTNSKILHPATKEQRDLLFQKIEKAGYRWNEETNTLEKLIKPKFKVGDKIKSKVLKSDINTIIKVCENHYELDDGFILELNCQDKWRLVSDKFDITTLTPFESKVLVRDKEEDAWYPAIWGCTGIPDIDIYPYIVIGGIGFEQCIPYEGNEHLCRTTNDCNEFYKTWE